MSDHTTIATVVPDPITTGCTCPGCDRAGLDLRVERIERSIELILEVIEELAGSVKPLRRAITAVTERKRRANPHA